jgi:quercetin dioxygenase-like cupin family protein
MTTVAETQRNGLVRRPEDRKWIEAMPGEFVSYRVRGEEVGGAYAIVEGLLPPLSGPPLHIHENEDEILQILEGSLRFEYEGETFDAVAGTFVVIRKGARHTWRNITDTTARALAIFSPAGAEGMFAAFAGRPIEKLEEIAREYGCRFVGPQLDLPADPVQQKR